MDDAKDKVWDRLKNGLRETAAEKAHRLADEYFASDDWRIQKERVIRELDEINKENNV